MPTRRHRHRNSLSSVYAEFCVLDPGEKHLGLEKKDLQASIQGTGEFSDYRMNPSPDLEFEGFRELRNPLTVEITLPRAPIRERMPLLHIGRLPCNEVQRESP